MPTPATPIKTPATAGPTIRAALNMDELSAIAFMRSSLPTSSTMNAWRAGMSNALTTPKNTASAMTCHVVTLPVHTSTASASASSICKACVHTMSWRLSTRSTTTPAYSVNSKTPMERSACVKPTANGELVMSSTSHPSATDCIQVPLDQLADFLLQSGFAGGAYSHPFWGEFGEEESDRSLDALRQAILQALMDSGQLTPEMLKLLRGESTGDAARDADLERQLGEL